MKNQGDMMWNSEKYIYEQKPSIQYMYLFDLWEMPYVILAYH